MTRCLRDECNGTVLADGYCDQCGLAPARAGHGASPDVASPAPVQAVPANGSAPPGSASIGRVAAVRSGSTPSRSGSSMIGGRLAAGLVQLPPLVTPDPLAAVLADAEVVESKRYCPACDAPVGRARSGRPGLVEGFCNQCGKPYSFIPKLKAGEVVSGQYAVVGCLAHGGLGWVYLARDQKLEDRWIVLKGLLNAGDESAMAAAIAERRFLAEVSHSNIVRIYNFVEHDSSGYIVMEYAGGPSLKELRRDPTGSPGPMPPAAAIAYVLEALPALAYLHDRGLLYCDFKPDNLIRTADGVKVIDLGGVRRMDDDSSDLYGTVGYQAPELSTEGASVASDLYTVARTLAVLVLDFPGWQDPARHAYSLPDPGEAPLLARYPSLYRFLLKATDRDPRQRFRSAGEMAEQLVGVLAQVVGVDGGSPRPVPSRFFSPDLASEPEMVGWESLPVPLVDPADPAAAVLATLSTGSPDQILAGLSTAIASIEVELQKVRALLSSGHLKEAAALLGTIPDTEDRSWRTSWWRGMLRLADGKPAEARVCFEAVRAEVPGELAPLLAIAVAAEREGDDDLAADAYRIVTSTAETFPTAAFGLSRALGRRGDRRGAVTALRRIPSSSSAYQPACAAIVAALTDQEAGHPSPEDLVAASEVLVGLTGDLAQRTDLTRRLMVAALEVTGRHGPRPDLRVSGVPLEEVPVRQALEKACRTLAKLAQTRTERIRLIDQANAYRPRSML